MLISTLQFRPSDSFYIWPCPFRWRHTDESSGEPSDAQHPATSNYDLFALMPRIPGMPTDQLGLSLQCLGCHGTALRDASGSDMGLSL